MTLLTGGIFYRYNVHKFRVVYLLEFVDLVLLLQIGSIGSDIVALECNHIYLSIFFLYFAFKERTNNS